MHPLREEIEAVIEEQGWSKASIANMTKLDSFVKESMRLVPLSACTCLIWYSEYNNIIMICSLNDAENDEGFHLL